MSDQQPPGHNPYQPQQPYGGQPRGPWYAPDHPQATTVLILGILGIAVCQLCAPFAWAMGSRVRREIDQSGGQYGGRGQVQAGYILGIVGSVLLGLVAVLMVIYVIVIIFAVTANA